MNTCLLCTTIRTCEINQQPALIYAFPHSYFMFGQHQFYRGYSVLVVKQHARELHQLPEKLRNALWQELMQAGNAIYQVFHPWKLNYASYGNVVEHIHWHIFPRYEDEPTRLRCPFSNEEKFKDYPTSMPELVVAQEQLRAFLGNR